MFDQEFSFGSLEEGFQGDVLGAIMCPGFASDERIAYGNDADFNDFDTDLDDI